MLLFSKSSTEKKILDPRGLGIIPSLTTLKSPTAQKTLFSNVENISYEINNNGVVVVTIAS